MLPAALAIRAAWRRLPTAPPLDPAADAAPPSVGPAEADLPVEIRQVSKVFPGPVRALDGCTFVMRRGSRTCLLGPNGAGKTTMLRLLTGALAPSAGVVRLWGAHSREPAFLQAKRRVGIVPQQPGMYRDTTAGEWLRFVQRLYGRGEPEEVAAQLGLTAILDRRMADLSGGTQRRLALAAALLPGPELLLLDEPTVGLDPVAQSEVRGFLQRAMAGRTVLLCTHNLAEAEELCSDVIILRAGRVLVHEPIAALKQRTASRLALSCRQGPAALAQALGRLGHAAVAEAARGEVSLPLPDAEAAAPDLLRALLADGLDVYGCRVVRPSLEELFLDILREQHAVEGPDASHPA
jgi:ABC-2 type transport system ATP-binding protein